MLSCQSAVVEMANDFSCDGSHFLNWCQLKSMLDRILELVRRTNFGTPPYVIEEDVACSKSQNKNVKRI